MNTSYALKFYLKLLLNSNSPKRLNELQDKLVRNQINYVYNNSKFYRSKFNASNLKPSMIKGYKDLHKIPILTKKEVIDNYKDIIILKDMPHETVTTSGSSGLTLSVIRTTHETLLGHLLLLRSFYALGVKPLDKVLFIHNLRSNEHWVSKILKFLRAYHLNYEEVNRAPQFIEKYKVNCVFSAPTTLQILGEQHPQTKTKNKLKLAISFAELLTQNRRKKIENQLNTPVYNYYAMRELPIIGCECKKKQGLHINTGAIALETIKNSRQVYDQNGNIIVTDLFNKCAPLIRYDTGDIGTLTHNPCNCGSALPLLSEIIGRKNDFIIGWKGKKISPMQIMYLMYSVKSIRKYRIIQKTLKNIIIKIVASDQYTESDELTIKNKLNKILPHTKTKIQKVKDIPQHGHTGKTKFIESKLAN